MKITRNFGNNRPLKIEFAPTFLCEDGKLKISSKSIWRIEIKNLFLIFLFMNLLFAPIKTGAFEDSNSKIPNNLLNSFIKNDGIFEYCFNEKYKKNLDSFSNFLLTEKIDLNNDSKPEYIIMHQGCDVCGSAGCSVWIYQENNNEYKSIYEAPILVSQNTPKPKISNERTNGYLDLGFTHKQYSDNGAVYETKWVKFDGKSYNLKKN